MGEKSGVTRMHDWKKFFCNEKTGKNGHGTVEIEFGDIAKMLDKKHEWKQNLEKVEIDAPRNSRIKNDVCQKRFELGKWFGLGMKSTFSVTWERKPVQPNTRR